MCEREPSDVLSVVLQSCLWLGKDVTTDQFEKAEFYCIGDPDDLGFRSPEEAIEFMVEADEYDGLEVVVDAFNSVAIDPSEFAETVINRLSDTFIEKFEEECGNSNETDIKLKDKIDIIFKKAIVDNWSEISNHIYQCKKVGSKTFSSKEVKQIIKEQGEEI